MNPIPSDVARKLADILDKDPIMAAQLKENIAVQRLLELLELPEAEVVKYYDLPVSEDKD